MKILLVEDEKTTSKAIAKGLRKNGYGTECFFKNPPGYPPHRQRFGWPADCVDNGQVIGIRQVGNTGE